MIFTPFSNSITASVSFINVTPIGLKPVAFRIKSINDLSVITPTGNGRFGVWAVLGWLIFSRIDRGVVEHASIS